ncbi:MAG: DoxX family membrane protein [Planctomycetes bacterium]|nr:DoxX family membrane protein [Planctomycetota bacterium]MBI3845773.1 DoxX family membrane protein [Planctomycetota bacterium]
MARNNASLICFIARGVCGTRFLMAGVWRVFTLTPIGHAEKWFTGPYAGTWLPTWALWVAGVVTPFVELLGGALVLSGLFTRWAALALGLVLIEVTFGHTLAEPLYSLSTHIFVDFVCLVVILWSEPRGNAFSLDRLFGLSPRAEASR